MKQLKLLKNIVSDSSGRYRGQSLYGNDFWLGVKDFCDDVNYESARLFKTNFIEVSYSISKVGVKLDMILGEVSIFFVVVLMGYE